MSEHVVVDHRHPPERLTLSRERDPRLYGLLWAIACLALAIGAVALVKTFSSSHEPTKPATVASPEKKAPESTPEPTPPPPAPVPEPTAPPPPTPEPVVVVPPPERVVVVYGQPHMPEKLVEPTSIDQLKEGQFLWVGKDWIAVDGKRHPWIFQQAMGSAVKDEKNGNFVLVLKTKNGYEIDVTEAARLIRDGKSERWKMCSNFSADCKKDLVPIAFVRGPAWVWDETVSGPE